MERKILTITIGALALACSCGAASAAERSGPIQLYQRASLAAPGLTSMTAEQPDVIAPPSDIDPGMAIKPPAIGAPMPIVRPPGLPGGRLGIEH
jgi:hypothetical protein